MRSSSALRNPLVVVVACAIVLLGASVAAVADEWGTGDSSTGAHPDADPHGFCYSSSVGADARENISAAEWNAMDPTAVNVNFDSTCNLSGSGETDVVWRVGNLAPGVSGSTYCEDFDTYCDQFYSTLDMAQIAVGSEDEIDETQTACHELGHTGGLSHGGSTDCMINSADTPPTDLQFRRYNQHHKDHLAAWF
jgi:hypothetical protein